MTNYKIFDISLPEKYIAELSEDDINLLIEEAETEHVRLEREIDALIWKDTPYVSEDGHPTREVWPSEFSYLPILYRDEIAADPALERRLAKASELSKEVGRVLAVMGSARVQQARFIAIKARIDMEENQAKYNTLT